MIPTNRLGEVYYLMTDVVKLRYLLRIFHQEDPFTAGRRPRFLLFVHWPMAMWVVEMS
jgi:hypothetical protein